MSSGFPFLSVSMAVMTKTESPQTIGVALLLPGNSTLHLMLRFASQVIGGSECGAVPFARGPRQWCQLSSMAGSAARSGLMKMNVKSVATRMGRLRVITSFLLANFFVDSFARKPDMT